MKKISTKAKIIGRAANTFAVFSAWDEFKESPRNAGELERFGINVVAGGLSEFGGGIGVIFGLAISLNEMNGGFTREYTNANLMQQYLFRRRNDF